MCNAVHPNFKLNGKSFNTNQLQEVAYSFIKEGKEFESSIGNFLLDWLDNNSFVVVQTSGSTGVPKRITLKKEQMVNSAMATGAFFYLPEKSKALLCLSADYIAGKMMLVRAMVLGWHLDCVSPSSKISLTTKYQLVAMVPLQVEHSLEDLNNIETLLIGGAAVSDTLKNKLKDVDTKAYETFGMTETITHIAARRVGEESYFKVLPNVSITTDDRGCLVIHAPKVSDQDIVTNDLVDIPSASSFSVLGRIDNVINSGGIKLIPEAIEKRMSGLVSHRFFVAGIPDEQLGQQLILVVEGKFSQEDLIHQLKSSGRFTKYEIPKKIIEIPKIIETGSGKINRKATLQAILG